MNKSQIKPLLSSKSFNDNIHFQRKIFYDTNLKNNISIPHYHTNISNPSSSLSTSTVLNIIGLLVIAGIIGILYYRYKNKINKLETINEFLKNSKKIDEQITLENYEKQQLHETIKKQQQQEHEQKVAEQIEIEYNKRPSNATDDIINNILHNNRSNNNNIDKYDDNIYRNYLKTNNADIKKNNPIFSDNKNIISNNNILNNNNGIVNDSPNKLVNINQSYIH